ncbi:MAG: lysoplasmalogenase [Promethearchaeota archaeon]
MTANIIILIIFFVVAAVHITGETLENLTVRYITKPLLMPLLALYYLIGNPSLNWWIFLGIIGGFGGDFFLMIVESNPEKSENYFTIGLVSFLLGHLFYIIGFILLANGFGNFQMWAIILMIPYIIYVIIAALKLLPAVNKNDPDMKLPVTVYLVIIGIMGVSTVFPLGQSTNVSVIISMIGSIFFLISDTILAFNKFKKGIPHERIYVMSTYILAQFFIVQGVLMAI